MALASLYSLSFRGFHHCRSRVFRSKTVHQLSARYHRNMERLEDDAINLFMDGVASVVPRVIMREKISVGKGTVLVDHEEYSLQREVFLVGFGKAVHEMALILEDILGHKIKQGIISVPFGTRDVVVRDPFNVSLSDSNIRVLEGAKNNIPDEDAKYAAKEIFELVRNVGEDALLFVLISGGGSALLPMPIPQISFLDKTKIVNLLAAKGASIVEMNTVRKKLSLVKGGGLAIAAYPCQVVALIMSDVIDDPLDSIASGPTCPNMDKSSEALNIIVKYELEGNLSNELRSVLERKNSIIGIPISPNDPPRFLHVHNVLMCSNQTSLAAMQAAARSMNYAPTIMTRRLHGVARNLGSYFAYLAKIVCNRWANNEKNIQLGSPSDILGCEIFGTVDITSEFLSMIMECKKNKKGVCLLFGGESTVLVTGSGVGGRNQEIALSFAIRLHKYMEAEGGSYLNNFHVVLLSGGTDGQDGPTPAAGAVGYLQQITAARKQGLDPKAYLENNDSYTFFSLLNKGNDSVVTGLTGTNVMDLQILLIEPEA